MVRGLRLRNRGSPTRSSDESFSGEILLVFQLPPSTNRLYQTRRGGAGKALTKEAKTYREHVKATVAANLARLQVPFDDKSVFSFDLRLYFDSLRNKKPPAKNWYKRIDVDNRVKFLQDCVSKSVGIPDDSQIFDGRQRKYEDPEHPRAEVRIRVIPAEQFFPGGEHG